MTIKYTTEKAAKKKPAKKKPAKKPGPEAKLIIAWLRKQHKRPKEDFYGDDGPLGYVLLECAPDYIKAIQSGAYLKDK